VKLHWIRRLGSAAWSGGLLRQRALNSDAVYRVLSVSGPIVEAEVVAAPGLAPGTHVRMTAAAAAAMKPVRRASIARRQFRLGSHARQVRRAA
jgi:ornithine cyclodeaminase/alanine dehydrogenase-like protein (mu-crystallin family)